MIHKQTGKARFLNEGLDMRRITYVIVALVSAALPFIIDPIDTISASSVSPTSTVTITVSGSAGITL